MIAVTMNIAKIAGGAISSAWTTADYTSIEARLDTWWGTLKPLYRTQIVLAEYRWYKNGPVWAPADRADGPPNPAERVTARAVPGTSAAGAQLPPQLAMSMTFITDIRKRWGRWYLPAPDSNRLDSDGRILAATVDTAFNGTLTLMAGMRLDPFKPVVFSRGRSAYVTPRGANIPVHPATAYEITKAQFDNLYDVIRSRRYSAATYKPSWTFA